jgi:hypothetical protein
VRFHKNRSPSGCHRSNFGKEGKPRSTRKGWGGGSTDPCGDA